MQVRQSATIWEKLGAAEGLWAAALLGIQFLLVQGSQVNLAAFDDEYARVLLEERMRWEWVTFLRIVAGIMLIWWMGSLAGRLRLAEGEPGRLATIAFGVGVVWGGVWLVSAMLNSAAILFAADYANPVASRMAGTLALESVYILTPALLVALMLATSFVALRHGGFAPWYAYATTGATALFFGLAVLDWYGTGSLSELMMWLALAWTAVTSAVLIPTYTAPHPVLGNVDLAAEP